ncbi:P-loop containing nucleoside triphosphate hydrolase protein [Trametes versicolor FP-101664 SS1]|uniref:P-loop containing nucleoside triphosphate hydrolase protein n=1 Tax=Trametes versicolor (strain FP-101664) TaxID=717944 RepID=UPI00046226C0|nr:P-loop containing nucleoside triphosphate hydrolase protein [Trametes versicolor FP-101664 SS1]EIW64663.1 P-loop containing nucleoside triphosphate hydrolase protein [Trametes versicolor FP-101664 SS1]
MHKVDQGSAGSSRQPFRGGGRGAGSSLLARAHKNNASNANASSRGGRRKGKNTPNLPPLSGPLHDEDYITKTYRTKPLKKIHETNPKSPLNNFIMNNSGGQMEFVATHGVVEGVDQAVWRSTITVKLDDGEIVGTGDNSNRKVADNLAALSALYQLDSIGVFEKKKEKQPEKAGPTALETTLSDGSVVDYEKARHFMDYYCRRFRFSKPDIVYAQPTRSYWQADMIVGDRRIGFGKGASKKESMMKCYTDVVQYLESCDKDIWQEFVKDVKEGKDLGMAPSVLFQADEVLEDRIGNLKDDIKRSTLYKNRPNRTNPDDGESTQGQQAGGYRRPPPSAMFLAEKSQTLSNRRQAYLTNPQLEAIRNTRATLPVFTKSEELLKHINENDVTICMAATGSGKTTQIPQLILDEYIDRGEGAKCNIICTQPRRIAAISVAERVAKERGETCGRGSVGYQVRFESKTPEPNGCVTYCTTGVFLRKMQSALLDSSSRSSMDDITHVIVDEVHERDVDIDLMLVVLKRLLAERRAQKKPIKIVLMSATIDSTLFRTYFPDEHGKPAGVVEIPGRAFPVQKNFLDDFVPELSKIAQTSWVFREESVRKYLTQELGPDAPGVSTLGFNNSRSSTPTIREHSRDTDDLDLPVPLVALTIAHVLRKSEDGHVLVFLPGWDDISAVRRVLTDNSKPLGFDFNDTSRFSIHLLHSTIPVAEQQAIFEPPPKGIRRVILSTNIAETSVTIPDVVYVVDTARVKEQRYDPARHISNLVSAWVGSSNLNQRAGRAGRHRPGEYYGILSHRHAEELHPHQTVEMKRVDLENVVMHVKALNFPGMTIQGVLAATIEPPAPDRIEAAIQSLHMVGALDDNNNLTSLGNVLLQLPVDVRLGRLVLFGAFFRCLDAALTLAAIMGSREPFVAPMHVKAEAQARKNFWTPEEFRSDTLAALRAYREWWALQSQGHYVTANRFCQDNFLSKPTLLNIQKVKDHLLKALYDVGVVDISAGGANKMAYVPPGARSREALSVPPSLNEHNESLPLLAALIAIACQPKFAIRTGERTYRTAVDKTVIVHPSSVNHRKKQMNDRSDHPHVEKQIVAFMEKRQNISNGQNADKYLVATTRLDPLTYVLFGAYRISVGARGLECDSWLPVIGRMDVLDDLERLKVMMEDCMLRVFQGIIASRQRKAQQFRKPLTYDGGREDESGDEEDADLTRVPLSDTEMKELDLMTMDVVRILNHYSTFRVAMASQNNSRPGTPMDSPSLASVRLPPYGGSRSGYSTPYGMNSTYSSRPGTPSRLSRQGWD